MGENPDSENSDLPIGHQAQYYLWEQLHYLERLIDAMGIDPDKPVTVETYKPDILPPEMEKYGTDNDAYLDSPLDDYLDC